MEGHSNTITLGFLFWLKFGGDPAVEKFRFILKSGYFSPNYVVGHYGSVYAFDLTNGLFLQCQRKTNKDSEREITLIEYELYKTFKYHSDNLFCYLNFYFHIKSYPVFSVKKKISAWKQADIFIAMSNSCDQEIINSTRKPGYEHWRKEMKQKGWLIDREVDSRIIAERRGESVPEIVPMEELM